MPLGLITGIIGSIGARKNRKKLNRLLKNAPKYKIQNEAFQNQALARSQAFGRNTAAQMQEQNIEAGAAQSAATAMDVSDSTSDILSTIAAIDAQRTSGLRGLAQDEAALQQQNMAQLYGANMAMIDEQDKAWNYNVNMPYQMKVGALRDKIKYNQELAQSGFASFGANLASGASFLLGGIGGK